MKLGHENPMLFFLDLIELLYGNNNLTFVQLMLFDDLLYFVKKDEKFKYFQRFSGVSFSSQKSGIFVSSC